MWFQCWEGIFRSIEKCLKQQCILYRPSLTPKCFFFPEMEESAPLQACLTRETGEERPGYAVRKRKLLMHSTFFSKSVSDTIYPKNSIFLWINRRYTSYMWNPLFFFIRKWVIAWKFLYGSPGANKNGSRYLSPKGRKYFEKSDPNSVGLRV